VLIAAHIIAGSGASAREPARLSIGCETHSPGRDDIIVCGGTNGADRYRLPRSIREREIARDVSWSARQRDELRRSRYADPAVGLGGDQKWESRTDYEWREGRKQIREEQNAWKQFTSKAK
jgi:hypothetical protein